MALTQLLIFNANYMLTCYSLASYFRSLILATVAMHGSQSLCRPPPLPNSLLLSDWSGGVQVFNQKNIYHIKYRKANRSP